MGAGGRSAVTMGVLCLLLVAGVAWGWSALTAPFPGKADAPVCEDRSVARGEKVYASQVVVSVYNAGERTGLAGRTMALFTDRGFREGESRNAPRSVKVGAVQVWGRDRDNPAVQLVLRQLRGHPFVKHRSLGDGVTVVVGDGFRSLGPERPFVRAHAASTICAPPVE